MRKGFFLFFFIIASVALHAQVVRVYGKITNNKLEPLSYASIHLKSSSVGTTSKEDGTYELYISKGTYEIIVSSMGYKTLVLPITVNDELLQNIILEDDEEKTTLSEVLIKVKLKDRADEIMKKLVEHRDSILSQVGAYTYKAYIKAVQQDSGFAAEDKPLHTYPGLAISEIFLKVDRDEAGHIKEEREGVKVSGEPSHLFYLSTTEGDFNFYHNLIQIPLLSPTPFVSPVSETGLLSYRFKTLNIERRGREKLYTISVRPRALTNATIEGEITVSDSTWNIIHCRFSFPSYHLQEYDYFEVEQSYDLVNNKAWMLQNEKFTYYAKGNKNKFSGETIVNFSDYNLNPKFDRRHFNTELSTTTAEAYKRDSAFWNVARREPLSIKEAEFIHYRDSITSSKGYMDSVEAQISKITWQRIVFFGQTLYSHTKDRSWFLPPVTSLYQPFAFGGGRLAASVGYDKFFPNRKNVFISTSLSYGLRNKDVNGSISIHRTYNPFTHGYYMLSAVREFQFIFEGDAWINMIKRSNIYLNNQIGVGHGVELFNGFVVRNELAIAFRRSVSNYKTGSLVDSLLGKVLNNDQPIPFDPYNAFYGKIRLEYTPFQQYRREPLEKIILGSKWPTFYVEWRKGFKNVFQSVVDFDYLEFGLEQQLKLGLLGVTKYSIKTGKFLNTNDLRLIDYQFMRRGDPLLFANPNKAFQALDSTFPVFDLFYEGHLVHEFNGFLINKIPLLKKLKLREIAGTGFLITRERDLRYVELFAGLERAFQSPFNPLDKVKLGVYIVTSTANKFSNPIQIKLGFTKWDKRHGKWY